MAAVMPRIQTRGVEERQRLEFVCAAESPKLLVSWLMNLERLMVVTVVAARTNRVSPALPVIVSDGLNGYPLGGDGRRPLCHWDLLCDMPNVNQI